jgi:hypothetical protein
MQTDTGTWAVMEKSNYYQLPFFRTQTGGDKKRALPAHAQPQPAVADPLAFTDYGAPSASLELGLVVAGRRQLWRGR